ncbi:hypothetical protein CEXT_32461 [Caerostris extrusa]|uniref:Uncharacterized protein n=1 Tax=Caerostris extrusa TaxID=172846 RepID=A0AAV4MRT3_CAEEX|nr:hypothetical protein CEXT_32461 [Caerostris extrusa]
MPNAAARSFRKLNFWKPRSYESVLPSRCPGTTILNEEKGPLRTHFHLPVYSTNSKREEKGVRASTTVGLVSKCLSS